MDYDKIIVELLSRIEVLEEKVADLEASAAPNAPTATTKEKKSTTDRIRSYLSMQFEIAKTEGKTYIDIVANDVQKALLLQNRARSVCNAMYQMMREGDEILRTTPSGFSTTVTVRYYLA
ncbi:MAG: hypothetical protein II896_04860 [Clostridia bacterium]|nr:hypothetical protein [Clostridia bacterium]